MAGIATDELSRSDTPDLPAGLLKWAGHREGGVKKPFQRGTGRPAGIQIMTPLLQRLHEWAKNLAKGNKVPTSILLVGGPGNGKTDAVDGLVECLDEQLGLAGRLYNKFREAYSGVNTDKPPRRVDVDLGKLFTSPDTHLKRTISIVQDATESDPVRSPGKSSQAILLDELEVISEGSGQDIYICCVNRGKLAEAYSEAQKQQHNGDTLKLLHEIMAAVTNSPNAKSCWPLEEYPSIVVWPMDVDSLVDAEVFKDRKTVIHNILEAALEKSRWPEKCPAGERCPFCTNRKSLASSDALDRLADLLRAFELGTGKRWTFRDLYSLVPYILVGDESELVIDGKRLEPCEWAARQLEFLESSKASDDARRARALHCLVDRLYWHRLFSRWPRLSSGEYSEARNKIIKTLKSEITYADDLFRYLAWNGRQKSSESIARLINDRLCLLLDPADSDPDDVISKATTQNFTVREIDEFFSLSVGQGLGKITKRITPLERDLLKRLAAADDKLGSEKISTLDRAKAELLQRTLRLFASRLIKRSLGVQSGAYRNSENLNYYKQALVDSKTLRKVQQALKRLVNNEERKQFVVPLMTTFAQPIPPKRRGVSLATTVVKVLPWVMQDTERPSHQLAYFSVNDDPVPLTFELFNALMQMRRGIHSGSLSDEVFAMVDRMRARVAGKIVRDDEYLLDDAVIILESTGEEIRFTGDGFTVEQQETL